ncbi:MAG: DUF21 domain-containing protein, partial [Oscillatoria sp. Prado101]|nr:DUF21 domain-containing protein [Oscillatoria sp. Prado101]
MELLLVFILILVVNFLLAASEIALAAFGESKIEELKENNDKYALYFEKFNNNQEQVYGSIHLASTFLTIVISIIGYFILSDWLNYGILNSDSSLDFISTSMAVIIASVILTIIILVFNVLVPKAIAYRYSDFVGRGSIRIILALSAVLKFITAAITSL